MSLILDALSRAERDKRSAVLSVPDLLAQPGSAESRSRPWLLWIVSGLLLCTLLVVFLLLSQEKTATPVVARLTTPASSGDETAATFTIPGRTPDLEAFVEAPRGRVEPSVAEPLASDLALEVEQTLLDMDDESRAAIEALYALDDAPVESARDDSTALRPSQSQSRAQVAADPAAQTTDFGDSTALTEERLDLASMLREVRAVAEQDAVLTEHAAPMLDELSKRFRDSVPTLMYLRHEYNSAGLSTVVINGSNLRVGQRTRNVEVREVLRDSVVLRFDSTDFRLRALNSWVNL